MSKFHFISGLPRTGSTLLSAILRQNPRFSAGITGPLYSLIHAVSGVMGNPEYETMYHGDEHKLNILRGLFESYHNDSEVIFDTNRAWTGIMPLLAFLYPESKIICCVRDIGEVINSYEFWMQRHPIIKQLPNYDSAESIEARVRISMNMDTGAIGNPLKLMHQAWLDDEAVRLVFVQYESLVDNPCFTMQRLYNALGEPWFAHDFHNVSFADEAYDTATGLPGMHTISGPVKRKQKKNIVPRALTAQYKAHEFWNNQTSNMHGVMVI